MCRLPQPSPMVRKLGKHLHQEMIEHGELCFVVWEQSGPLNLQRMDRQPLSQRVIEKMIREHKFEMDRFVFQIRDKVLPTHINLCFGNMTMVPISGFPRSLLTADNHNGSPRSSQSALPMFQTGLGAVSRAASRYTHGSRRLKRQAAWEPPSLHDFKSIPDLRQYGDPDRIIGSDVVNQQSEAGTDHESFLPEVVPVKPRPAPVKRATTQQQRPQEQPSTRSTLRNAFRALLWPIRAHPPDSDHAFPEEAEEEAMSQFVASETGRPPPWSHDGRPPSGHAPGSPGPYSPNPGPLTMQYYHVDSAENDIYQQWVNLLGPTMGGQWVPVNNNQPHRHDFPRGAYDPAARESIAGRFEMSGDSVQPVELQADSWV